LVRARTKEKLNLNCSGDRLSPQNLFLCAWLGLIFFSSTGVAGRWANELYALFSANSELGAGVPMLLLQKGYHVVLFAVLGWLLVTAGWPRLNTLPRAVIWSFAVGALSEALQLAFEGRGPSLADVALNGASGSLAAWIWTRLFSARHGTAEKAVS
jgi:VanZ family protein